MSREFPDWVDPWKAAQGNRVYRGTMALEKMSRLKPLLAQAEGEAKFKATFAMDTKRLATIQLVVETELPLRCQASLGHYLHPVRRRSMLAVIEDEGDQYNLPGHYEATRVESGQLVFLDVVQDELILEVPQVPRKPGLESVRYTTDPDDEFELRAGQPGKPFGKLAALMQNELKETDTD